MMRRVFALVIATLPADLRCRYREEMLWVFDECPAERWTFVLDVLATAARRRLASGGLWRTIAAVVLAFGPMMFGSGLLSRVRRMTTPATLRATVDTRLVVMIGALVLVLAGTTTFAVTLHNWVRRRRG